MDKSFSRSCRLQDKGVLASLNLVCVSKSICSDTRTPDAQLQSPKRIVYLWWRTVQRDPGLSRRHWKIQPCSRYSWVHQEWWCLEVIWLYQADLLNHSKVLDEPVGVSLEKGAKRAVPGWSQTCRCGRILSKGVLACLDWLCLCIWTDDTIYLKVDEDPNSRPDITNMVVWFHDESTFYAHDHHTLRWCHKKEGPKPQPKGEGISLMVAHFVSADYGYLQSPNGTETACILFRAGKGRDGYYTNDRIIQHAEKAMEILQKYYLNDDHILIFDNATTHVKWADNALSARHMPKNPSHDWGVTVLAKNDSGAIMYHSNGKPQNIKVPMEPGHYANGEPQLLYFPNRYKKAGWFKGMAQILQERGLEAESTLPAECKWFRCPPGGIGCCCHRVLYNQPDFVHIESILESTCHAKNVQVLFFPKFHCELNFIEQVWGCAKCAYCEFPPLSKESDLERNVIQALDSVSLVSMCR